LLWLLLLCCCCSCVVVVVVVVVNSPHRGEDGPVALPSRVLDVPWGSEEVQGDPRGDCGESHEDTRRKVCLYVCVCVVVVSSGGELPFPCVSFPVSLPPFLCGRNIFSFCLSIYIYIYIHSVQPQEGQEHVQVFNGSQEIADLIAKTHTK